MRVAYKKWKSGQKLEKEYHNNSDCSFMEGWTHYSETFKQYCKFLKINSKDLEKKSILEIGPAIYPMLGYCHNSGDCYVIEPTYSQYLKRICSLERIKIFNEPAEYVTFPKVDEVWIFNVLQHVISPETIIYKSKKAAKVIRFFEPINTTIDDMHHWTFDAEFFARHFGLDIVKHYGENKKAKNFHAHECAYGVWRDSGKW